MPAPISKDSRVRNGIAIYRNRSFYLFEQDRASCLGPAPNYASMTMDVTGRWHADLAAGTRILRAFSFGKGTALRQWTCSQWCERKTGQGLLELDLVDPHEMIASRNQDHWEDYQATIPLSHRLIAKRYRRDYGSQKCRLAILRLLSVCPQSEPLARENAAVFLLLADHLNAPTSRAIERERALALVKGPQREILGACGLPRSEEFRQLLRKVPCRMATIDGLRSLGAALQQAEFRKTLLHIREVPFWLLKLLDTRELWPFLSKAVIQELLNEPEDYADFMSRQLRWLWVRRSETPTGDGKNSRRFQSVKGLSNYLSDVLSPEKPEFSDWKFPPAPFPGTDWITPIRTAEELFKEGQEMKLCAGNDYYQREVVEGRAFFYRAFGGERLTVQITRKSPDDPWVIREARCEHDRIPSLRSLREIVDALDVPASPDWYPCGGWWVEGRWPFMPRRSLRSV